MKQGSRTDLEPSANLPEVPEDTKISQKQAAELLNVSERSTREAKTVLASGDDDLIHEVEAGDMSVGRAPNASTLPGSIDQLNAGSQPGRSVLAG